jgi:prophage tail gpP-like protein
MELKLGGKKYDKFNGFTVTLNYDSVASAFSFLAYFNPENKEHLELFKPCSYRSCSIEHGGETLITGTVLSHAFKELPIATLASLSGYSKAGVLEDCQIPTDIYPLQSDGLTLKEIAEKLTAPFGLSVAISQSVEALANEKFGTTTADQSQSIKAYIATLAAQKGIILSHTSNGNLILTKANTTGTPIAHFDGSIPNTSVELTVNGQAMHSTITVIGQASTETENASEDEVTNPFVSVKRPKVAVQSSGTDNNTQQAAMTVLREELKNIAIKITTDRWEIGGKLVRPNSIVTVTAPNAYLFGRVRLFVQSVTLAGNETSNTATLNCVLPSVFGDITPVNIFN